MMTDNSYDAVPEPRSRSERRRQTKTITIRCTAADKARFTRKARRHGFVSVSAWIKDLMRSDGAYSLQMSRVVCGHLGQIGGRVTALQDLKQLGAVIRETALISQDIASLQKQLMKGAHNAGESDP